MNIDLWKHFRKDFSIYIGIGIAVSLLSAANVFFFQKLLDEFRGRVNYWYLLIYAVTLIIVPIISYLEQKPKTKLQNGMYFYMKKIALKKIGKISFVHYLELGSGSLLQKIEAGSNAGRNIYLNFYGRLFKELIPETFFNLLFIAILDIKLIPFILIGYIIVFVVTKILLTVLQAIKESSLISEEMMNGILIRGITEMVTFRINKRYRKEIEKYDELASSTTKDLVKMTMIHEFFFGFFALLVAIIKTVIVVLTFTGVIDISLGGLIALVTYVDRVYTPVAIFNVIFVQFNLDKVTFDRLEEFYNAPDDPGLFVEGILVPPIHQIQTKNLDLYIQEKPILNNLSIKFERGRVYGLIGESGVGKSTLVKTILGLLKPTKGEVLLNQTQLSIYNLNDYYSHVFYLSQDAPIFQGTLKENIVFDKNVSDEKVIEALRKCQLSEFYHSLNNGLSTKIGEKGSNISGGEKQRIAFARMFFSEAEVIIIDEATSALDEVTEENVLAEVKNQFADKLVVIITHRPKNLKFVDEIIELKK